MVKYQCADGDCKEIQEIDTQSGEPIRCVKCGHRVLYKVRTKKTIQYVAR